MAMDCLDMNLIHILALKDNQLFNLKKELEITKNAYVNLDKKRNSQVTELQNEIEIWKRAYHKLDPVGFILNKPLK